MQRQRRPRGGFGRGGGERGIDHARRRPSVEARSHRPATRPRPARSDWTNFGFGNPTSAPGGRIGDDRRLDLSRDRPRESSIRRAILWKPPMRPPLRVRRHATAAHRPSFRRSEAVRACLLGGDERSCDVSCSPSGDGKASTPVVASVEITPGGSCFEYHICQAKHLAGSSFILFTL